MWIEMFFAATVPIRPRSSPTRGMWIEIAAAAPPSMDLRVIPHTGDVD